MDVRENLAVEERLAALLRELDIRQVHVAGGYTPNAVDLARSSPGTVASVALISPMMMATEEWPEGSCVGLSQGSSGCPRYPTLGRAP